MTESRPNTSPLAAELSGGFLPGWAPYGVVGGSAALAAAVLLAFGAFSVALTLVGTVVIGCVVLYGWSRSVEGSRRALDRVVTFLIISAFGLAMIPLLSLLFEVL
jgi:phosphate transport system permease protein